MIQKLSKPGAGFRGILNYALAAKKEPELIGGNMAGETAQDLAQEFGHGRSLNLAVHKPVFATSLTAAPADQLSESDWQRFAARYVERMGYGNSQWVLIRHHDTDRDHVHIIANRVDSYGRRVEDFQEIKRGEAIVRDLEREFGITQVTPSREARRAAPQREELALFGRTERVPAKARLQEHVDVAARDRPSLAEFAARLREQGVELRVHVASTGRLSGLSFALDGVSCKGSDLGRGYSWQGLAERKGVHYETARDLPQLRALGAVAERDRTVAEQDPARRMTAVPSRVQEASLPSRAPSPTPRAPATSRAPDDPPVEAARGEEVRRRLSEKIDCAAQGRPTLPELVDRLDRAGVRVQANMASTGRLSGLSFELEGIRVKGSELGRNYAWRGLAERHGITFEPTRDRDWLGEVGAAPRRGREETPPPASPGVSVYRSAAVLASRLEIEARTAALEEQRAEYLSVARADESRLAQRAADERRVAVPWPAVEGGLRRIYQAPEAAGRALEDLVKREGALSAAKALEQTPEQLGALRGVGVGILRSAARREAQAGAAELGQEFRTSAARQARLAEGAPAAAEAARWVKMAREQVHRLSAAISRLPSRYRLEADMVRAAGVLGKRLTSRLAPPAVADKLIWRAIRAARELLRGRDDDRSLGR
jgi:Relaxase/Mobilisation nuclease domain